jgi:hypothetical protein
MNTSKHYLHSINNYSKAMQLKLFTLITVTIFLSNTTYAATTEKLAVLPFEIVDNTPVPGGEERNQKMLEKITRYIAQNIDDKRLFKVIPQSKVNKIVSSAQLGTDIRNCNQCEFELGKQVEAEKVMTGWIYKMSILILTMHIEIKDVATQQTFISKAYDFRGDNEKAWLRAADYMLRDLGVMMGQ